jgi:hypothetical protein
MVIEYGQFDYALGHFDGPLAFLPNVWFVAWSKMSL